MRAHLSNFLADLNLMKFSLLASFGFNYLKYWKQKLDPMFISCSSTQAVSKVLINYRVTWELSIEIMVDQTMPKEIVC